MKRASLIRECQPYDKDLMATGEKYNGTPVTSFAKEGAFPPPTTYPTKEEGGATWAHTTTLSFSAE